MTGHISRRTLVRGIGLVGTAGALAGCTTGTRNGDGGTDGGDGNGGGTVPSAVSDYLSDANNFDGSVVDETGSGNPTVDVGAGDGFSFGPAAIRISSGTTVTWEWTGQGVPHNVVHEEGNFESDLNSEAGATFEHTFESSGTYLYFCQPHKPQGMKGAVVVE